MLRPALGAVLLAMALETSPLAHADSFDLTARDKQLHVATSYGLTLTLDLIARRFELPRWQAAVLGAATTIIAGTTKELLDDDYDWGDQLGNAIGIGGATTLVFVLEL